MLKNEKRSVSPVLLRWLHNFCQQRMCQYNITAGKLENCLRKYEEDKDNSNYNDNNNYRNISAELLLITVLVVPKMFTQRKRFYYH